jgi:hypothetical protein
MKGARDRSLRISIVPQFGDLGRHVPLMGVEAPLPALDARDQITTVTRNGPATFQTPGSARVSARK